MLYFYVDRGCLVVGGTGRCVCAWVRTSSRVSFFCGGLCLSMFCGVDAWFSVFGVLVI